MRTFHAAIVAAGLSLAAPSASAQWRQLPSQDWAYTFDVTTTGVFRCGLARHIRGGTCTASGNSLLLTYGEASLTLTFVGVTQPVTLVTGPSDGIVNIGVGFVQQTLGGSGQFLFPSGGLAHPLFTLSVGFDVSTDGPVPFSDFTTKVLKAYALGSPREAVTLGGIGPRYVGVAPPPDGVGVTAMAFERFNEPRIVVGGGTAAITANAVLLPEPATVALTAGGLLALGGVGALRRRRA